MRLLAIQRIFGLLLMVFSTTLLPPVVVSLWYNDGAYNAFVTAFLITLAVGVIGNLLAGASAQPGYFSSPDYRRRVADAVSA